MKTTMILSAALLISAATFAQNSTGNQHGASVSGTAKSTTEVATKGATVSEAASVEGQAHMGTEGAQRLSRKAIRQKRKAEKELARQTRETKAEISGTLNDATETAKNEHGVLVSTEVKNAGENANNDHGVTVSTTAKASVEAEHKGSSVSEVAKVNSTSKATSVRSATKVKATRPAVKTKVRSGVKVGLR